MRCCAWNLANRMFVRDMFGVRSMHRRVSVNEICIGSVQRAINYLCLLITLVLDKVWLVAARREEPAATPRMSSFGHARS
jgi:hypothetical protein